MSIQKSFKSLTRGIYDDCAYKKRLAESVSPLLYSINPIAYESCTKCKTGVMAHPQIPPASRGAGFGFGMPSTLVDVDSDLRRQTRLLTNCPSHKYNPLSYNYCQSCPRCDKGLPCGCSHCVTSSHAQDDCHPGIIPVEALDTRAFDACNPTKNMFLSNQFQFLCSNPQAPQRWNFYGSNRRLGANTQLDIRDHVATQAPCSMVSPNLPKREPCTFGNMGCRYGADFGKGIYN